MNWVNSSIFYHIYPLGFCGAPAQNCGEPVVPRIEKILGWIPHMKSLGVNACYLGPLFQSSGHGYDTSDYYQIDPRLGDRKIFQNVCAKLHEAGIRIVVDGVFNHVGRDFWAFRDVLQNGQASRYCDWFQNLNFDGTSPMGDPFQYEAWQGHFNLVKLNLQNSEVVDHLLGAIGMWIDEFGIDGLRLDAADCVDRDFFRHLRPFCREKRSDFWLMGEIVHGDYNCWANDAMLDSVTNYECYKGNYSSHNDKNYFEIAYSLNRQFGKDGIYKHLCLYSFTDNHDVNRLASTLKNPMHIYNVYTLLYTMPGVPSIYYGSEWGISGIKQNGSDAGVRPCLELGNIPDANFQLTEHLKKLGTIRHFLPGLQTGEYEQTVVRNEQFVFRRYSGDQSIYVALNLSDHPECVVIPCADEEVSDMLTGTSYHAGGGNLRLEIPKYGALVLTASKTYREYAIQMGGKTGHAGQQKLRLGRYRHFKGGEYRVLGIAKYSETQEDMVVYQPLYGEGGLWVRPLSMFLEDVERDGKVMHRFTFLSEE